MPPPAATAYSIGSPTRICAASGRPLAEGERYVAVLAQPRDRDEFIRLDFAQAAWDAGSRPGDGRAMLGHWRGTVNGGDAKRRLFVDDDSLLELFERSGEESAEAMPDGGTQADGTTRLAFRFVLALILLRKRLLIQEGSSGKGGKTMLVRPKGVPKPPEGPALVEVIDPGMSDELVAKVSEQLRAVLTDSDAPTVAGPAKGGAA